MEKRKKRNGMLVAAVFCERFFFPFTTYHCMIEQEIPVNRFCGRLYKKKGRTFFKQCLLAIDLALEGEKEKKSQSWIGEKERELGFVYQRLQCNAFCARMDGLF